MYKEAQHLSHLIDDLRMLSLADTGELPLNRRPCRPAGSAGTERPPLTSPRRRKKEIDLEVAAAATLPEIDVDPDRMAQVLNNLVSNALRHTPAGRPVLPSPRRRKTAVSAHRGRYRRRYPPGGPAPHL